MDEILQGVKEYDHLTVKMIIEGIQKELKKNKRYIFALNMPRLSEPITKYLQGSPYKFMIKESTGCYGEHSTNQIQYIINR